MLFELYGIADMEQNKKKNILRNNILFAVICIIVIAVFLIRDFMPKDMPRIVEIVQDGTVTQSYSLTEDRNIRITDAYGNYNIICIAHGTVQITEADCSNQDCVRQGEISRSGQSIICLPHRLVIRIKGAMQEYDAVSW